MIGLQVSIAKRLSHTFSLEVEFSLPPGFTVILGPSGAGKTTLLNCIAGLLSPERGCVALNQRDLYNSAANIDLPVEQRHIGYVFQTLALFPHYTAEQNIQYGINQKPETERMRCTQSILHAFRIAHTARRRPAEISGGERQRVALARTLVTEPELLLLDEPLSALDRSTKTAILDDLRVWNQTRNIPVIYVTHSPADTAALGAQVLFMKNGRMVKTDPFHTETNGEP